MGLPAPRFRKAKPWSRKQSFAKLKTAAAPAPVATPAPRSVATKAKAGKGPEAASPRPISRESRKQIADFFTPEMGFAMHMLARRRGRSLALMAEAFNDVVRKHGESPIGE